MIDGNWVRFEMFASYPSRWRRGTLSCVQVFRDVVVLLYLFIILMYFLKLNLLIFSNLHGV